MVLSGYQGFYTPLSAINQNRIKMKMLFLFLLMLIACVAGVDAQSDVTKLSVTYECFYQKVLEVKKQEKDIMRLDIGQHSSQFVSPILEWIKKNKYVPGSPNSRRHPYQKYDGTLRFEVFKNTPKQGYQYFIHDPGLIATRDKTEGLFTWELLKSDSIVCHYPCHKAQTTFRGRTWTVWYALDLPYNDGPWKLCGLPGLILHAQDSTRQFIFDCIGIEKGDGHTFG